MEDRLARFFLRRLRRAQRLAVIERAIEQKVLVAYSRLLEGRTFRAFAPGPAARGKSAAAILRLLNGSPLVPIGSGTSSFHYDDDFGLVTTSSANLANDLNTSEIEDLVVDVDGRPEYEKAALLDLIGRTAEPPCASDVATLLMIAKSVADCRSPLTNVIALLKQRRPVITILGKARGFESRVVDLARRGLLLPGRIADFNGYTRFKDDSWSFRRAEASRWRVVVFEGAAANDDNTERMAWQIEQAVQSPHPVLAVSEREQTLPKLLREAAMIALDCGPLTPSIIAATTKAVLGAPVEVGPIDCTSLRLSHLSLAIRPGLTPERAIDLLTGLSRQHSDEDDAWHQDNSLFGNSVRHNKAKGQSKTGNEVITPVAPVADAHENRFVLHIETLSGYGQARDWALTLQDELAQWRDGTLDWQQMSTKLLLSGPPGTGKTSFARALCNSLQLPLIATSVATWLEPGHLGDVLKRMQESFAEARSLSPCILFIDEIDGIGKRLPAEREHATYWNSVVNRALELLDGAKRSSGIIVVGATNNRSAIDPALLRAGRLETSVEIPLPDTEALIGILRHHLGEDLDAIVATANATQEQDQGQGQGQGAEPGRTVETMTTHPFDSTASKGVAATNETAATEAIVTCAGVVSSRTSGNAATDDPDRAPHTAAETDIGNIGPLPPVPNYHQNLNKLADVPARSLSMTAELDTLSLAINYSPRHETEYRLLRSLALQARGLSGADIERLVREARRTARRRRRPLILDDLTSILTATRPHKSGATRHRTAIHEAAHAVVRLVLEIGTITIITIDGEHGSSYVSGTTAVLETETEAHDMAVLTIGLAGRAAEELMLGNVSAGAGGDSQSDLASATNLAVAMETALGFSDKWPLLYRRTADLSSLLLYHPEFASSVNGRLESAYQSATAIVDRNRTAIALLADTLIDHETLEGDDLETTLAKVQSVLVAAGAAP